MAKTEMTLGQKLRKIQKEDIAAAFRSGDENAILTMRNNLVGLAKLVSDCRTAFDSMVDQRDMGLFGDDFAPSVSRIRAKGENVGRPKSEKKDLLAELDL